MDPTGDEDEFLAASTYMRATPVKLDNDQKLKLYGLFKQASGGDCNTSKPGIFDMTNRAKWTAWNELKGLAQDDARCKYVDLVTQLVPAWRDSQPGEGAASGDSKPEATGFGPVMSTMVVGDEEDTAKSDSDKTVMELVAADNVTAVRKRIAANRTAVSVTDDENMTALHWACDRGNIDMVELLLKSRSDVNAQESEGQTPLHYASSCNHLHLVPVLVEHGAKGDVVNVDGETPAAVSYSKEMTAVLSANGIS